MTKQSYTWDEVTEYFNEHEKIVKIYKEQMYNCFRQEQKGGQMSSDLQKQISMINDLYVSSSSSGRLFAMKEVVRDLQAIVNKSVQSENDKYEGQSLIKAMHKVAELIVRYQKEIHEEEQANKQKVEYEKNNNCRQIYNY